MEIFGLTEDRLVLAQTGDEARPIAAYELLGEAVKPAECEGNARLELDGSHPRGRSVVVEEFVLEAADRLQLPQRHFSDRARNPLDEPRPRLLVTAKLRERALLRGEHLENVIEDGGLVSGVLSQHGTLHAVGRGRFGEQGSGRILDTAPSRDVLARLPPVDPHEVL